MPKTKLKGTRQAGLSKGKQQYGRDYDGSFRTRCKNGERESSVVHSSKTVESLNQLDVSQHSKWRVNGRGNDDYLIKNFKSVMKEEFEMTDMGLLRYFLAIEVDQNESGIFISQAKYVNEVLGRFNMQDSKAAVTPTVMGLKLIKEDISKDFDPSLYKSIVGSLMYLTATRPDIMFAVSLISRFMERPKEAHWQETKRILRYVKGTKRFGILYTSSESSDLVGYTDSDWAGSVDDRKSTSGYIFHMGSGAISWASKKQSIVALSTAEAEYVAATAAACQVVWMRRMLRSLGQE
eukprot:PITA_11870